MRLEERSVNACWPVDDGIFIVIIVLKGAIRDFYDLLLVPRTVSDTHAQVARAQSCANHVQHIERLSRATCRVLCVVKRQLNYNV